VSGDRWIRRLTVGAVLLVAAIAATVSFVHIQHLAITNGQTRLSAMLLPVSIDGTVLASSMVMVRAARLGIGTPWLSRVGLALSVAATLAANLDYGLSYGLTGALISAWPALAFLLTAELAIGMLRQSRSATVTAKDATGQRDSRATRSAPRQKAATAAGPDIEASALAVLARQPGVSGADLGRAIGASPRTGQRLLARLATANGQVPEEDR
jgi:hypothetical protein